VIHGLVKQPLIFSMAALLRYPLRSRLAFIECGGNSNAGWHAEPIQRPAGSFHGMVSCSEWTGVPVALLLREAGIRAGAAWVLAEGADGSGGAALCARIIATGPYPFLAHAGSLCGTRQP